MTASVGTTILENKIMSITSKVRQSVVLTADGQVHYQKRQTEGQDEAVENDLLKDQDKRMPMKFERSSKNFGGTKK